jgi:hypothetical protein
VIVFVLSDYEQLVLCVQDQIVLVAVLSVLWASIDPKEHKKLGALKVRQWPRQLLATRQKHSDRGQWRHINA